MDWNSRRTTAILENALLEDRATRDATSYACIDPAQRATGTVLAKQECILAGVGAIPRILEVYAALDQKAIDGQENPPTVISANKLYEVQKYIVMSNHQYNPQSLIFSKKVWDTLRAADRKILADAAVEAAKYQRQVAREAAGSALENLKKNGMQVTELSAAELAKFREAMKPVIAKHSEIVGAETVAAMQAALARLRR